VPDREWLECPPTDAVRGVEDTFCQLSAHGGTLGNDGRREAGVVGELHGLAKWLAAEIGLGGIQHHKGTNGCTSLWISGLGQHVTDKERDRTNFQNQVASSINARLPEGIVEHITITTVSALVHRGVFFFPRAVDDDKICKSGCDFPDKTGTKDVVAHDRARVSNKRVGTRA